MEKLLYDMLEYAIKYNELTDKLQEYGIFVMPNNDIIVLPSLVKSKIPELNND